MSVQKEALVDEDLKEIFALLDRIARPSEVEWSVEMQTDGWYGVYSPTRGMARVVQGVSKPMAEYLVRSREYFLRLKEREDLADLRGGSSE